MPKFSDRSDGNELDLSLNNLDEVPIQDLMHMKKATHIDLSCNKISVLPNNFATLTHLVKIDLSKNHLTELPQNFGNLTNLQHLDLYGNQLSTLPVSFGRLRKLKWLDLKNNPLDPGLKVVAGDCLDPKQCQNCAKDVVTFLQGIEMEMERRNQKKLDKQKRKEEQKLAEQAKMLEEQRLLKKTERERKKAATRARIAANSQRAEVETDEVPEKKNVQSDNFGKETTSSGVSTGIRFLVKIFVMLLFAAVSVFFIIKGPQIKSSDDAVLALKELYLESRDIFGVWWQAFALPWYESTKASLKKLYEDILVSGT